MEKGKNRISKETVKAVRKAMCQLNFDMSSCPLYPAIEHEAHYSRTKGSYGIDTHVIYVNTDIVSDFTLFHEVVHSQQLPVSEVSYKDQNTGKINFSMYKKDISECQANIVAGLLTGKITFRQISFLSYIVKDKKDLLYFCQQLAIDDLDSIDKKKFTRSGRVRFNKLFRVVL